MYVALYSIQIYTEVIIKGGNCTGITVSSSDSCYGINLFYIHYQECAFYEFTGELVSC